MPSPFKGPALKHALVCKCTWKPALPGRVRVTLSFGRLSGETLQLSVRTCMWGFSLSCLPVRVPSHCLLVHVPTLQPPDSVHSMRSLPPPPEVPVPASLATRQMTAFILQGAFAPACRSNTFKMKKQGPFMRLHPPPPQAKASPLSCSEDMLSCPVTWNGYPEPPPLHFSHLPL